MRRSYETMLRQSARINAHSPWWRNCSKRVCDFTVSCFIDLKKGERGENEGWGMINSQRKKQ